MTTKDILEFKGRNSDIKNYFLEYSDDMNLSIDGSWNIGKRYPTWNNCINSEHIIW